MSGDIGELHGINLLRHIDCRAALQAFEKLAVLIIPDVNIALASHAGFKNDHWIVTPGSVAT